NHGSDFVDMPVECMNVADCYGFFARAEPGFRKDALFYPAPKRDVVQPKTEHAGIHVEKLRLRQLRDDMSTFGIAGKGASIFLENFRYRLPIHIFRWIEHRVTLHELILPFDLRKDLFESFHKLRHLFRSPDRYAQPRVIRRKFPANENAAFFKLESHQFD